MKRYSFIGLILVLCLLYSCVNKKGKDQFCTSQDGLEICYSEYGSGENLIVFVHGWSCDKGYWREQIDLFKQDYHLVCIDLGGHGKSGTNRKNWTMSAFGDDVNAVLSCLKFENAYLVGHSMGSDVILEAANKWDSNNIELFLIDRFNNTPVPWTGESFDAFIKPFKDDFEKNTKEWVKNVMFIPQTDPELIDLIACDLSQANPDIAISALTNLFGNDYIPIIDALTQRQIKMTIVNSDYKPSKIDELKELGFDVELISDCGHIVMLEQPHKFNQLIKNLIED